MNLSTSNILIAGATAAGGYFAGHSMGKKEATEKPDQDTLAFWISRERALLTTIDNYKAQIATLQDIIVAGDSNHELKDALLEELRDRLADLEASTGQEIATALSDFPIVLGTGEPEAAGYVRGRQGLIVHRNLSNFIGGTSFKIGMTTGATSVRSAIVSTLPVANVTESLPPQTIMIGRGPNANLRMELSKGLFGGMAVILNFEDDVSNDEDLVVCGHAHYSGMTLIMRAFPIGKNSLMIAPVSVGYGQGTNWTHERAQSVLDRDSTSNYLEPTVAQRASWQGIGFQYTLGHRSARQLTLRSYNIVANPFLLHSRSYQVNNVAAYDFRKRIGPATVIDRINLGGNPKFYRAADDGNYTPVDLPLSSYL